MHLYFSCYVLSEASVKTDPSLSKQSHPQLWKQMKNFENENAETICLELIIGKEKWCILLA